MSHTDHCPDRYTAEREGRRVGEGGYRSQYSNPYRDECPEAAESWSYGYRRGEYDRIEREEEEYLERIARSQRLQVEQMEMESRLYIQETDEQQQQDYGDSMEYMEYQEWCEAGYLAAERDDEHLRLIVVALEMMAMEAIGE